MCNLDNKVQIGENDNRPAVQEHNRVSDSTNTIETFANQEYKWGFVTDIEADAIPRGLSEDVVRLISAKKKEPEWLLQWRLTAYRHWLTLKEPEWANIHYPKIDYQDIIYYSSPKPKGDGPKSLDDVDPELLKTYAKLGIPLQEQAILAGVAVDAVFDSVSVATTFKAKLHEVGIIFGSFSEAVKEHPELVRQYLGSVVPTSDNFSARPTRPCSAMAVSATSPRVSSAPWSFP